MLKRLFLLCTLSSFIVGCAELFETQPPAPVYGNGTPLYGNKPLAKQPKETVELATKPTKEANETVKTAPLKNTAVAEPKEIKPEPLPAGEKLLTPEQEKELLDLQSPVALEPEEAEPKPKPKPEKKPEPVVEQPVPPVEKPAVTSVPFQELESFSPMSPAVSSLVLAANADNQKGNVEAASNTLERASRIEPRNGSLYYKMALLKLKSKPSEAEDLAKKSALLAANDVSLKKHSWLLIAKAREMQKNFKGAEEARTKASKY
jgi:hypothetical protein